MPLNELNVPDNGAESGLLEVAAGVIVNAAGEVLIARRADHLHQGGYWEFPGGKLEPGESPLAALQRELEEELGIVAEQASPLLAVRHAYPDRRVRLRVFRVERFSGHPRGRQGQPIRWVPKDQLLEYRFPAANRPIVTAARLPDRYAILDAPTDDTQILMARLTEFIAQGITLIRLRVSRLDQRQYEAFAQQAAELCQSGGVALLLNGPPERVVSIGATGMHLRSAELMALEARPLGENQWVAASCHNAGELAQAAKIGVDFVVLGPVAPTATHPEASPLGWDAFARLVEEAVLPVYALGGLDASHLPQARSLGAQGVAAIRGFGKYVAP